MCEKHDTGCPSITSLRTGDGTGFCAELDRIVRSNFTGDYWEISLPNRLDTSSARSPVLSAYWAALILLDAESLFSDLRILELLDSDEAAPRSIERHHLFPKAYLEKSGFATRRQVNLIANMAFLDWPDNATIGRESPQDYWPAMAATMSKQRLEHQVYWHALPVGWEQLDYGTFLDRRRGLIARVVHDGFNSLWRDRGAMVQSSVADLLALGESQSVEFKSTARWNLHTNQADKRMEQVVTKTVCGFLNSEGGTLLIGVDDNGAPIGLVDDMRTLGKKADRDGYELFLRQQLDKTLSSPSAGTVRIHFEQVNGYQTCAVSVAASGKPVFSRAVDGSREPSEFWVRISNATKQLHGDDMVEYLAGHWG